MLNLKLRQEMWLIRMREWEIGAIFGRLQDNPGEFNNMYVILSKYR